MSMGPRRRRFEDAPVETVSAWAMNAGSRSPVLRPRSVDDLREALAEARARGATAGLRGAGRSYGDAALNSEGVIIDFRDMNRILSFDPATGILEAEPGVTIEQVWRRTLPEGWWPAVVPGTMFPTLGGCAAMNIHGKNNFRAGTLGQHIRSFDLLLADGTLLRCSQDENVELFYAAIGGFGMLGAFARIELALERVHSGDVWVRPIATPDIASMIDAFEEHYATSDYLVGWIDAFGGGRGLIHQAWYLEEGEDADVPRTVLAEHQDLPSRFFWVVPRRWLWAGLWCFFHRPGMRLVNAAKYHMGKRHARHPRHRQSLVGFSFLLDYVPNWKYAYRPGSFIQYQAFVPRTEAARVFDAQLDLARKHGVMPYLCVLKKHLPDPFLMTHAVDGYSLALDIPLGRGRRDQVWALVRAMDEIVLAAKGRFYFAKDSTLTPEGVRRAYPEANLDRFLDLKRKVDPEGLFQTDLSRRLGVRNSGGR
jgi:FAD/FMN-containing dehydrogenase